MKKEFLTTEFGDTIYRNALASVDDRIVPSDDEYEIRKKHGTYRLYWHGIFLAQGSPQRLSKAKQTHKDMMRQYAGTNRELAEEGDELIQQGMAVIAYFRAIGDKVQEKEAIELLHKIMKARSGLFGEPPQHFEREH